MKNMNGLENAMRLVESACEKGEITIIGEGEMPSPQELLVKCAEFVEKQYSVSVKMLAIVGNHAVSYDTACHDYEEEADEDEVNEDEDEDEDEDEEEVACFYCAAIEDYLDDILYDRLDQIAEGLIKEAIHGICSLYAHMNGKPCESLSTEDIVGDICEVLNEAIPCISNDKAREIAKEIEEYIYTNFFEAK